MTTRKEAAEALDWLKKIKDEHEEFVHDLTAALSTKPDPNCNECQLVSIDEDGLESYLCECEAAR